MQHSIFKERYMKKVIISVLFLLLCQAYNTNSQILAAQDEPQVLQAQVECTWVNLRQTERDAKVKYYHGLLFDDGNAVSIDKKTFRKAFRQELKDKKTKTHYRLISKGVQETPEFNMSGFFKNYGDTQVLYAYALQPKNNLRNIFYYSAFGSLAYIDNIQGAYPNFPYTSKQYRANGKLAGVIYFENHDVQYVYKPDGTFKGLWFKDKMYNRKGQQILTRTNW